MLISIDYFDYDDHILRRCQTRNAAMDEMMSQAKLLTGIVRIRKFGISRNIMACTEPSNDAVGDDADDKISAEDADN